MKTPVGRTWTRTVEEVARRSRRDGCPRFEFLEESEGRRMNRATGKHTFQASAIDAPQYQEWQRKMYKARRGG